MLGPNLKNRFASIIICSASASHLNLGIVFFSDKRSKYGSSLIQL